MELSGTKPLAGRICLVTGSTRGIGLAIARMLVLAGARVCVSGRSQSAVNQAITQLQELGADKVEGKAADVRDSDQVGELFRFIDTRFGGLDVLVNNAGVGIFRPVSELSVDEWKSTIETNLYGVFFGTREALLRLETRGKGYIVNISSLAGANAFAGGVAYNASKFALTGFSEAAMQDLRSKNVRVSYIMPGSVATEFGGHSDAAGKDWKIWPEDVAQIVKMLLFMPERTLVSRVEDRPSRPPQPGSKR